MHERADQLIQYLQNRHHPYEISLRVPETGFRLVRYQTEANIALPVTSPTSTSSKALIVQVGQALDCVLATARRTRLLGNVWNIITLQRNEIALVFQSVPRIDLHCHSLHKVF